MFIKKELQQYQKNLQKLKEQAALYGMTVPLDLTNNIDYHEQKIQELQEALSRIENENYSTSDKNIVQSRGSKDKKDINPAIIIALAVAIIGAIATITGSFLNYLGTRTQIELPMMATQTAEMKLSLAPSGTHTTELPDTPASERTSILTPTPDPNTPTSSLTSTLNLPTPPPSPSTQTPMPPSFNVCEAEIIPSGATKTILLEGPNPSASKTRWNLGRGTIVNVVEKPVNTSTGTWYHVQDTNGVVDGWVLDKDIELLSPCQF